MTVSTTGLSAALLDLARAVDAPHPVDDSLGAWRLAVCQRLGLVREQLLAEGEQSADGRPTARGGSVLRGRAALLVRTDVVARRVLEEPDLEAVRVELRRLLADVARVVQRLHDRVYDEVEQELGGSE